MSSLAWVSRCILGVSSNATSEEIKAAYKKCALDTHPDKGGDPDKFRQVRDAYEALKLPAKAAASAGNHGGSSTPSRPAPFGSQGRGTTTAGPPTAAAAAAAKGPPAVKRKRPSHEDGNPAKAAAVASSSKDKVNAVNAAVDRVRAMPVERLSEQLSNLSPKVREQALVSLLMDVRAKLRDFMVAKRKRLAAESDDGTSAAARVNNSDTQAGAGVEDDSPSDSSVEIFWKSQEILGSSAKSKASLKRPSASVAAAATGGSFCHLTATEGCIDLDS